jgi:hypothetical protein
MTTPLFYKIETHKAITNTNRSNHLVYKESILSGYGITNFTKGKFDIQAGLRAEYINYNATSLTSNNTNKDNYLSLFHHSALIQT